MAKCASQANSRCQPRDPDRGEGAAALAGYLEDRDVRDVPEAVLKRLLVRQESKPLGWLPAVKGNTLMAP